MSPEEIIEAYNVVAQDVKDRAAQDAAVIGNSQRSLGPLASTVASPSGQTSGLANYTYNRVLRPTLETTTTGLITQGKAQALQTNLTNELLAAKQRYEDAKNNYTVASTAPKTTSSSDGSGVYKETSDIEVTGEPEPETKENTDNVVTGTSALTWERGSDVQNGYIMIGTPPRGDGSPGEYVFQDSRGNIIYVNLPEGHEFVIDPETKELATRPKK